MSDDEVMACEEHNLSELPRGYDKCPQCMERRRVQEMEQELMARRADPTMHNMVDAPANAIDH